MAAFINLAADPVAYNILEVVLRADLELEDTLTRKLVNVFHYHKTAGSGSPDLTTFLGNFATLVASSFIALLNIRVTNATAEVRPLDDPLVMPISATPSSPAGLVTGDPLSAAVAAVVTLNTGVRGRSFQGRKHFGGLSESNSDGGDELNPTTISNWAAAVESLFTVINDGASFDYTPCVLSSTLSLVGSTPPVFTGADIIAATLNPILGTMRRRKEKVPA